MPSKVLPSLLLTGLLALETSGAQAAPLGVEELEADATATGAIARPSIGSDYQPTPGWGYPRSLPAIPDRTLFLAAADGLNADRWEGTFLGRNDLRTSQVERNAATQNPLWFATTLPWVIPAYTLSIVGMWGVAGGLLVYPAWLLSKSNPNADHAAIDAFTWNYTLATLGILGTGFGMVSVTNAAMRQQEKRASGVGSERLSRTSEDDARVDAAQVRASGSGVQALQSPVGHVLWPQ